MSLGRLAFIVAFGLLMYAAVRFDTQSPRSRFIAAERERVAKEQEEHRREVAARAHDSVMVLGLLAGGADLPDSVVARAEETIHERALSIAHPALHQRYADLVLDSARALLSHGHEHVWSAERLVDRILAGPLQPPQQDAWMLLRAGVERAHREREEAARRAVPVELRLRREFAERFESMIHSHAPPSVGFLIDVDLWGIGEDVLYVSVPGNALPMVALIARDREMVDGMRAIGFTRVVVRDGVGDHHEFDLVTGQYRGPR